MRLFAPKNSWSMTDPNGWWGLTGSLPTASGIRVGVEGSLKCGPAHTATRVLVETMLTLPCNMMQRQGRDKRDAEDHALWNLLRNEPNPEQDSAVWFDQQVGFQVLCGNAYAEIQRDRSGNITGLWPIHPSRLPTCNIRRNPTSPGDWKNIVVGQPGEIVYYVRQDDGTLMAIPASDMLHVPGVGLNGNGITGRGLPEFAADALGVAVAADTHAGSFFRNGALSNFVITSKKNVGKETAERLREQFQRKFAGAANHYKTLLLEDEMDIKAISVDPEQSQLIQARKLNSTDVVMFWRVQPHMIGDLERATFSNIEQLSIDFVKYTMLPWVVRWEKALYRQLLTAEEKRAGYYFKFNVNGLLRGDEQARAQFYQILFNIGAFSPDDIRELEDRNPLPGGIGAQYFIQGNNAVPLDKVSDLAQAQIDKAKQPPPVPQRPDTEDPNIDNHQRLETLKQLMSQAISTADQRHEASQAVKAVENEVDRMRFEAIESTLQKNQADTIAAVEQSSDRGAEAQRETREAVVQAMLQIELRDETNATLRAAQEELQRQRHEDVKTAIAGVQTGASEAKLDEIGDKIAEFVGQKAESLAVSVTDKLEAVSVTMTTAIEQSRDSAVEAGSRVVESVERLSAEHAEHVRATQENTSAAVKTAVSEAKTELSEAISDVGKQVSERPEPLPVVIDTSAAEALAVREQELQRRFEEHERVAAAARETAEAGREAGRGALQLALDTEIADLADWESRWLEKAVEKPRDWVQSRTTFYDRFVKSFETRLRKYAEPANVVGVRIDSAHWADAYVKQSVRDLRQYDAIAADNHYDALREKVDYLKTSLWKGRPGKLSAELIQHGKDAHNAAN